MEGHAPIAAGHRDGVPAWERRSTPPPLVHGDVQVWRIALEAVAPAIDTLHALLAPEERHAVATLRFPDDRARRIAGRAGARLVLAAHLETAPAEIPIETGRNGRPALPHSEYDFNISHSGACVLVAVSRGGRVGVDIERIRAIEAKELAARFFAPTEVEALDALPEPELLTAFFTCWTRKEAVTKLTGDGVLTALDQLVVWPSPHLAPGSAVRDLDACEGYAAALATSEVSAAVHCFELVL